MNIALPEVQSDWPAVCSMEQDEPPSYDNVIYTVFAEVIDSSLLGHYCGYGISVIDEQGSCLCTVHDITCEKERLEGLVNHCNCLHLSLCHLYDVIEDFLG